MTETTVLGTQLPWPKIAVGLYITASDTATFLAAAAANGPNGVVALDYDNYNTQIKSYVETMTCMLPPMLSAMIRASTMAFMSSFVANPALGQLLRDVMAKLAANIKNLDFRPFLIRVPAPLLPVFEHCARACMPVRPVILDTVVGGFAGGTAGATGSDGGADGISSGVLGLSLVPLNELETPMAAKLRLSEASALPFSSQLFAR